jgi:phage gp36-like protein
VRGFVRAGGVRIPAEAGLIPPSLVPFALDFAAYRLLKRFNVAVGEERRKAYDAAMDVFKAVAAGKMAVEPAEESEDATSSALPSFVTANPERRLD